MRILVINSGSSTLKFDLVEVAGGASAREATKLARGLVDRIGRDSTLELRLLRGDGAGMEKHPVTAPDHHEAVRLALGALDTVGGEAVGAVGHRVVHGGAISAPTLVDDALIGEIEALCELAPLHNPGALQGIRAAREEFGPGMPMVAVFDTAFHSTLPPRAYTYAIPSDLAERHRIRRYGFHGTAHEYMLEQYAALSGRAANEAKIITLQLGNGCSACAISAGKPVDTSMGFTPLEGLVMGTRSGDLDPALVSYLAEKEGIDVADVDDLLNNRSGLLGMSGTSGDMRTLLAAEESDPRAALAIEVFCYRVRKYIGAYMAVLGGAAAVVFGGGIGENAAAIRARIIEGMERCGLRLDPERNEAARGREGAISAPGSDVAIYVVQVDESLLIAKQTASLLETPKGEHERK